MIAVYLGETNEEHINDMSIVFFNSVLAALGKRVNYDAVVNYAGNGFAKDSWKMIQEANPLMKPSKTNKGFIDLINQSIRVNNKVLEGTDWAEGLMNTTKTTT